MNAIGRNIIIKKLKEGITTVVSTGSECDGINKDDVIYYDRHAGHKIELDKETYHVIKAQDVVFVL